MDNQKDLEILIASHYPIICIETFEEMRVKELVRSVSKRMGLPLFFWKATEGLRRASETKPVYKTKTPMDVLNFINASSLDAIYLLKDIHRYLEDPLTVRKLRDISQAFHTRRRSLILTAPSFSFPLELEKEVVRYELSLPKRKEMKALVQKVVRDMASKRHIAVQIDSQAGTALLNNLQGLTLAEAERVLTRAMIEDGRLDADDIPALLDAKKDKIAQSGILEYFPRDESFSEVGGLAHLKKWLTSRKGAFTEDARRFGLPAPRGVLLLGVQGCGKSLMAKAIAQEWGLPLLKMDMGSLYNKYIGETEKNLREAIGLAESLSPVVLWIDEIEKGFSGAASSDNDGGVSTRLLGTFLSWLQEKKAPVFVVATSNDISKLPPELLRKGRLDEIFFVDLPGAEERKEIISLHLNRRKRDSRDFDLDALVQASEGFSGAEIEEAIVSALYAAFSSKKPLNTPSVLRELKQTYPLSVVMKEQVQSLREWARDGPCRQTEGMMKIGYRATTVEEVEKYPADLIQISYWKRFGPTLDQIDEMVSRCREIGLSYVLHPVFTPLSETDPESREKNLEELIRLARIADLGMILHDETLPGGERLSGERLEQYRRSLEQIESICPFSIENATNTADIDWFWKAFHGTLTLDMGHFESSGIDSVRKVKSLPDDLMDRVEYVHMHRKNGDHGGILDHWPLTETCREVEALKVLVQRKRSISVILEVNEMDQVGESLEILYKIAGNR